MAKKISVVLMAIVFIFFAIKFAQANEGSFSDNYIAYRFGMAFKEPSVANGEDIQKNIANFTHFNTDKLGSNFFTVDTLFSNGKDPEKNSSHGATEVYAIFRRDWSMSKIMGKNFSRMGIIRDVALHMGADMNTKNVAFAPRKKFLVIGPELQFALPSGYFNLAFDYSQEWNHNGIVHKNVSFDPAFEMEATWGIPFHLYKTSWNFTGFFNYVAPKGRDGFGAQTKEEILTRPELLLDVGKMFGKNKKIEVGVGYEYWLNKFGNNHTQVAGSKAKTLMLIVKLHF